MGIYGRLLDSSNLPITSEFEISTTTVWDQKRPRVSCDDAGNFVVTWQGWDQDEDGWAIVGRRFASDATALGPEFIVNTSLAGDQKNPDLAMSPNGDVTILWQGPLADSEFGIFGQIYDSTGLPVFLDGSN